jgi:alkylation response protein AidB-like acyl-CoA dehydrogenase
VSSRFQTAIEFLREQVAPRAHELDLSSDALLETFLKLGEARLLGLKCPQEFGNEPVSEPDYRSFQQECARTSGVLAFLQTQHQSAVSLLSKSDNADLKKDLLPGTVSGDTTIGIGFSQLRRQGAPLVTVERVDDGLVFDGHVPWVTGHGFFREFLVAGVLPNGEAAFALVPFRTTTGIVVSNPMRLAAMESARTVTVDMTRFFVGWDRVAFVRPAGWIQKNDMINVALQGHFAIGNARAALDVLEAIPAEKRTSELESTLRDLLLEWTTCKENLEVRSEEVGEETTPVRLEARAWAIDVMQRCAWAAVTASAGAANSVQHPAQRILREALVFTVSAQTAVIRDATLTRLTR